MIFILHTPFFLLFNQQAYKAYSKLLVNNLVSSEVQKSKDSLKLICNVIIV